MTKTAKTYRIGLIVTRENGMVAEQGYKFVAGISKAMTAAKKMAGAGATFFTAGANCGYTGAVGTAWIVE